ncbi:MAG: DNRLRE domain-containing protein, partial [Gaiellaceae bacterium]
MRKHLVAAACAVAGTLTIAGAAFGITTVVTSQGTWTAYPGQSDSYQAIVQQPIDIANTASEAARDVSAQTIATTFSADADTRVHEASPTTNFGSRTVLRVDGAADPEIESYLRFTVLGLAGSIQRATLRLHAVDATADGPRVSGTTNGWSESAMTWNDRPAPATSAVDDAGAIAANTWAELDVTSLIAANGTFSFVLTATHQDGVDFDSRESTSTSLRPELVLETLTTNAPVNTSPPTISGVLQEGNTLTAASGTWNGSEPMMFVRQWRRCDSSGANCVDIADATAQTYALTQADVGATLRVAVTATNNDGMASATSAPSGPVLGAGDLVIAAAGDIASCTSSRDEATAQLVDSIAPTRVLTLGDHVYPNGTDTEFATCYEPSWGRHKGKTSPAPGNHDYNTPGATGYFNYFGAAAGDPAKGYYAFDLGAWRIYALNSNCAVVPCAAGSQQEQWLRADLAAHPQSCLAAYWHHPRFSSGDTHGSNPGVSALWNALYDYRVDLVLQGHEHIYERYTRLDPSGTVDLARGIRSFVVGTGGAGLYSFVAPVMGSEARGATHGVLKLVLRDSGYDWTFVPVAGSSFTDSGSDSCGGALSDTIPPSAPANLVSTAAEAGNVGLAWGESNDAVGVIAYDVYRDTQLIGSTTATSFTDTSAVGGSSYQYYVTARDAAGNDSAPSNTIPVTVVTANQSPSITSDGGGPSASLSPAENQTAVTDVDA